jgi:DNA-binding response OmpR family regulator
MAECLMSRLRLDHGDIPQTTPPWQCRVLVVDDDEIVQAQLANLLRRADYDVQVAASGDEALRVLHSAHCHMVLTDWQMPGMDGLELCRRIRDDSPEKYVYVMMLTARESKQDRLLSIAAGADDYVAKGLPVNEVLARMDVARRIIHHQCSSRKGRRRQRDS